MASCPLVVAPEFYRSGWNGFRGQGHYKDYASLVGVSKLTIHNWESGRNKPGGKHWAALVSLKGIGKREAQKRLELLEGERDEAIGPHSFPAPRCPELIRGAEGVGADELIRSARPPVSTSFIGLPHWMRCNG